MAQGWLYGDSYKVQYPRESKFYKSGELAHAWAHQLSKHGKCPASMYFDGDTIYSYGYHFPMARLIVDRKTGKPCAVLLTTRTYSPSTSGHQSDVRRAVSHLKQIWCENVLQTQQHAQNLRAFKDEMRTLALEIGKGRSGSGIQSHRLGKFESVVRRANDYCEFFGLKTRFGADVDFKALATKQASAMRIQTEREKKAREKRLIAARAKYQADLLTYPTELEAWRNGGNGKPPRVPLDPDREPLTFGYPEPIRLRLRGSRIETSAGAVVEAEQVKPIALAIRGLIELPEDYTVQPYNSSAHISRDCRTVRIGCHTLPFDEIELMAQQLGM